MAWDDWVDAAALVEHGARHRWDDDATSTLEVVEASSTVLIWVTRRSTYNKEYRS